MTGVFLSLLFSASFAAEPSVVVSANRTDEELSQKQARKLFTGRALTWPSGEDVFLVLPAPDSAEMEWLSSSVLGLAPSVYQRFIQEQAYRSGNAAPPTATGPAQVTALAEEAGKLDGVLTVGTPPLEEATLATISVR